MVRGKQPKGNTEDEAKALQCCKSKAITVGEKSTLALVPPDLGAKITNFFTADVKTRYRRPLFQQLISAGFPSPAEDPSSRHAGHRRAVVLRDGRSRSYLSPRPCLR
jgi:hypothetical protein